MIPRSLNYNLQIFAPLYFVVFVLLAQFVLVNVVVAVLMKHLEETHKQVSRQHPQLSLSSHLGEV